MVKEISKELAEHVFQGGFIHCKDIHDHSCEWNAVIKFKEIFSSAYKFYIPLHLMPVILFKRKKALEQPKQTLIQTIKNIVKSSLFLSVYVAVFRYLLCATKNNRMKVDRWNIIISSFVCGFAILFEAPARRGELALYLVPRAFESLWNIQAQKGRVRNFKYGEVLIFACCMSLIMYCYQNDQQHIKPAYLNMFKKFFGIN